MSPPPEEPGGGGLAFRFFPRNALRGIEVRTTSQLSFKTKQHLKIRDEQ